MIGCLEFASKVEGRGPAVKGFEELTGFGWAFLDSGLRITGLTVSHLLEALSNIRDKSVDVGGCHDRRKCQRSRQSDVDEDATQLTFDGVKLHGMDVLRSKNYFRRLHSL